MGSVAVDGRSAGGRWSRIGVSIAPGHSTLTRTPRRAASGRSASESPTTACFAVAYAVTNGGATRPGRTVPSRWTLDGGQPTDLGALGGGSASAEAVNDAGVAAGWADGEETDPWGNHIRHAVRFPAPAGRPAGGPAACGPASP